MGMESRDLKDVVAGIEGELRIQKGGPYAKPLEE